ncbi:MAG: restriction endonuclease [Bacteroidales bacterium]|nr:restriction endonuclease [Bacteroidales bacterium]
MAIKTEEIKKPTAKHGLKGATLFHETRIDKDILEKMDEDTYEELVTSWAYWCLKEGSTPKYEDVYRIGGSGDGGIDVIAYYDLATKDCDIYQCKHYDHPVNRSDVIAELGKFLYHVSIGDYKEPRNYYLMAPQGLSGPFNKIYSSCEKLKKEIVDSWNKDIAKNIESKKEIKLEGTLKSFVEGFDYYKFKLISPDKLLKDVYQKQHRHVYFLYFGVRRDDIERIKIETPSEHDEYEKKYIQHLIDAYNDAEGNEYLMVDNVEVSSYGKHFDRSREQFWLAESIRKMSEEQCPGDTDEFKELEEDMIHHVADMHEAKHENAFEKVKAVTDKATSLPKKENRIISGELSSGELKGVCFQLSNEDILIWKEK